MPYCDNCEKEGDHFTMKCPHPKRWAKRKVLPAAKPPDSIPKSAVQKSVDHALNVAIEATKHMANPICEICGDKAHHDYLDADKLRKKLYMQERRAKEGR